MAKTLSAQEHPIDKIFSNDYVFHIPDYQRPYAWTKDQAGELLDDLLGFIRSNPGNITDMPSYFLGSIVLIKQDLPDADVVDGQQRLTTLTLLLSAIRSTSANEVRELLTKRIHEKGDVLSGSAERFRLTLRDRDAEFFQRYVQREGGFDQLIMLEEQLTDAKQNLRDNARLYFQKLKNMSDQQRQELAAFILQRCFLVVVSTNDQNSAFRIFSVLNSRGLDLSVTDILKAKIIGGIPDNQRESYNKKWEDCEEELGRDDFNTLFGHIRTVARKAKAQETLLKEFELYVIETKTPLKFIDELLRPMAHAYGEISAASYSATSHSEIVNEHLRWLNRLEFNDWVPPALAFFVRHRNDPGAVKVFVNSLERLAYYMLVASLGVNARIERFARVVAKIEKSEDLYSKSSALQLTRQEQLSFYQTLDGKFYENLSAKARTSVLLRLDNIVSGGGASYDYDVISVEHVLPQNPKAGSRWLEWFPDQVARDAVVHRLGNLALLTRRKNSSASNWDFERKKDSYFRRDGVSPFVLTTQVLNCREWNSQVVANRHSELMKKFELHWRLEDR